MDTTDWLNAALDYGLLGGGALVAVLIQAVLNRRARARARAQR